MIELFFIIIAKIFLLFFSTVLMLSGFACFMAYLTNNKGLARGDSMAMVNIPGKGKRYYKMPAWFGGIILAILLEGMGIMLIYFVMYVFGH